MKLGLKLNDEYTITYRDFKFQQIENYKSFSFKDIDNAFENLYSTIMDGLKNPPEEDIMLELPEGYLWLNFTKSFGVTNLKFAHSSDNNGDIIGFSTWLTKKKVTRLFGKNKK